MDDGPEGTELYFLNGSGNQMVEALRPIFDSFNKRYFDKTLSIKSIEFVPDVSDQSDGPAR